MESRIIKPWNPLAFFKGLVETNKLCQQKGFKCVAVSGLEGMEEAIARMQSTPNLVMVAENAVIRCSMPHPTPAKSAPSSSPCGTNTMT